MKLIVGTVLAIGIACPAVADRLTPDETTLFIMQCEDILSDRLSNRDSYVRKGFAPIAVDAGTLAEFMGIETPAKAKVVARHNQMEPVLKGRRMIRAENYARGGYERISTTINYETMDLSGAMVAKDAICTEYLNKGLRWAEIGGHQPSVDNFTWSEWMDHSAGLDQ